MKICGCANCRLNGERNLQEEFEIYYSTRQLEADAVFENIFKHSYTVGEMEKLYAELEPQFSGVSRVVARIKSYSMSDNTWNAYNYWEDNYGHITKKENHREDDEDRFEFA